MSLWSIRFEPLLPTYPTERRSWLKNSCSTVKFHCCRNIKLMLRGIYGTEFPLYCAALGGKLGMTGGACPCDKMADGVMPSVVEAFPLGLEAKPIPEL